MPKASQILWVLLPLAILAGLLMMDRGSESTAAEPMATPVQGTPQNPASHAPPDSEIHSQEVVQRRPESARAEALADTHEGYSEPARETESTLLSRHLHVPLSFTFLTTAEQPELRIEVGKSGAFTFPGKQMPKEASLLGAKQSKTIATNQTLKILPEGKVLFSNICTLLLDAAAGPLPDKIHVHAAFLATSGRVQPVQVQSIESGPGGWIVRIDEPMKFCTEETIERVLLCIDPPIKDHVRTASWTLSELRISKATKLTPLPTHSLPLTWKGLVYMGNIAAHQDLGTVLFSGTCNRPGFQGAAALNWLAAPPGRRNKSKSRSKTYDRIPRGITQCAAFFSWGSVAQADLPHTDDWKFGVELFPDTTAEQRPEHALPGDPDPFMLHSVNPQAVGSGGGVWVWDAAGSLLQAMLYEAKPDNDARAGRNLPQALSKNVSGAILSTSFLDENKWVSEWVLTPYQANQPRTPQAVDQERAGRFRIVNQSQWTGDATLFLLSMKADGVSLRPIPIQWPRHTSKKFKSEPDEIAWFLVSPTAKGAFGLLGQPFDLAGDDSEPQAQEVYELQVELTPGWSSLLVGDLVLGIVSLPAKMGVKQVLQGDRPSKRSNSFGLTFGPSAPIDALRVITPAGSASANSALSSAQIESAVGPWGIQILNSEALPVFLDLGFGSGPTRRIQPNRDTVAIVLELTVDKD